MLKVKLVPRSSRNQIIGKEGGIYRIKITAPPVEGKANNALIEYLSGLLEVPKGMVLILSGETSRMKILGVAGLSAEELQRRLDSAMP
ncbi:MAG: DUF167 domain-containing protein [Desulfobacteraceae bacterium]|nr:MAG: DUF167 domain-containing protein [Desulfobacteraceae bacterium]